MSFEAKDVLVIGVFVAALIGATLFLLYARRGRAMRARLDQMQADGDRKLYESNGKVRPPPVGPLP